MMGEWKNIYIKAAKIRFMEKEGIHILDDKGYKIRCVRSLLEQIMEDHAELNRMWKRLEKGETDTIQIDEIVRVLSWLRQGINVFKESKKRGIEGIYLGEIKDIEEDIKDKEEKLKLILFSLAKEINYCHLR
jgi:hypothetical protein